MILVTSGTSLQEVFARRSNGDRDGRGGYVAGEDALESVDAAAVEGRPGLGPEERERAVVTHASP